MTCPKINNQADLDLTGHQPMFDSFFPYSQKTLGYEAHPAVNFISDKENAVNPLGKTGFYDPSSKEITIYTDGRHIKDVLRSIAHELVHHAQNERGEFDHELDTSPGYALEDGHLWNMEQEAYKDGNSCFRRWEDTYKQQLQESKKMKSSKIQEMVRKELKKILSEQGFTPAYQPADDTRGSPSGMSSGMSMKRQTPRPPRKRKRLPVTTAVEMLQAKLNLALAKLGKPLLKVDGQSGRKTRSARRFISKQRKRGERFNDTIARIAGISSEDINKRAAAAAAAATDVDAMPSQLATADPDSALGKIMSKDSQGELEKKMTAKLGTPPTASPHAPLPSPVASAGTQEDEERKAALKRSMKGSGFGGKVEKPAKFSAINESKIRSRRAIRILNKLMEKIGNK